MSVQTFTADDLQELKDVQPAGWQPIAPVFRFYLQSPFCSPISFFIDGNLAGVGTIIFHDNTAWLAHIIVSPVHRNNGIGKEITKALIQRAEERRCKTISLLATTLGEPVYTKLGFTKELDYVFLQNPNPDHTISPSIVSYEDRYGEQILKLDADVSAEGRASLLVPHLNDSKIILRNGKISGFYLPTLGEGLVVAGDPETGIALLQARLTSEKNRIGVPAENKSVMDFLLSQGYSEFQRGSRMYLGDKLHWQPSKLYSRIGGNLG